MIPTSETEPEVLPEVLFTPLELQGILRNAYAWQTQARQNLFAAARALEFSKRNLARHQQQLRLGEDFKALPNDKARDTYLVERSAELLALRETVEDAERAARLLFEEASTEVEQARALLRVAELAAGVWRER